METGIDVNIPVSESGSLTKGTVFKLKHSWTIENFTFYLEDKILRSATFSAEGFNGIEWSIELLPQGGSDEKKPYISLYLSLERCDRGKTRVAYTFSLLNSRLENIRTWRSSQPRLFEPDESWGFEYFVERDCVFKHLTELAKDELTVCCEMIVLVDPVNVPHRIPLNRSRVSKTTVSVDPRGDRVFSYVAPRKFHAQELTQPSKKVTDTIEPPAQIPSSTSDRPKQDDPYDRPNALENHPMLMKPEILSEQLEEARISGSDEEVERINFICALNEDPFAAEEILQKISLQERRKVLNWIGFCLKCGRQDHVSEICGSQIQCPHREYHRLDSNGDNGCLSLGEFSKDKSDPAASWSPLGTFHE